MVDYKKPYASLLSALDEALTLMDGDDLLQWDNVKGILTKALLDAEEQVVDQMDELEELKSTENS